MDYVFLFYIFVSFVIATGGAYILASSGRIVAALLYLIGVIAIEAFFGTRWFQGTQVKQTTGPWPPAINTCPDFLSLHKIGTTYYCVDTTGIAPNGGIEKWNSPAQADDRFLFKLYADKTGSDRTTALCQEAKVKRVTWEGVFDGTTCLGGVPPMPPKA